MQHLGNLFIVLQTRLQSNLERIHDDEGGFNTAELLGNAALAIVALVAIWGLLTALGTDVVGWIRLQLGVPAS